VGISEKDQARLFEPFFSTKGQRGTGLGLAVTRKIVEEHRGRIEVISKVGQGTTFRLMLPLHPGVAGEGGGREDRMQLSQSHPLGAA
jgi:signal transduction histidine kinase